MSKVAKWDENVKQAWDKQAESWDSRSENMWDRGSRKDIVPFFEKYVAKGSKVIDIGCGSGYGTFKLQQAGYDAVGIDVSQKMIELATDQFSRYPIEYFVCNIRDLSKRPDSYDAIMAINILEWTEDPKEAINDLYTILNDGGYLCAGILGPTAGPRKNSYPRLHGDDVIFNTMMPWEFEQLAQELGFALIDEYGVYKKGVTDEMTEKLSKELKQALSFMWVFMMQKNEMKDDRS